MEWLNDNGANAVLEFNGNGRDVIFNQSGAPQPAITAIQGGTGSLYTIVYDGVNWWVNDTHVDNEGALIKDYLPGSAYKKDMVITERGTLYRALADMPIAPTPMSYNDFQAINLGAGDAYIQDLDINGPNQWFKMAAFASYTAGTITFAGLWNGKQLNISADIVCNYTNAILEAKISMHSVGCLEDIVLQQEADGGDWGLYFKLALHTNPWSCHMRCNASGAGNNKVSFDDPLLAQAALPTASRLYTLTPAAVEEQELTTIPAKSVTGAMPLGAIINMPSTAALPGWLLCTGGAIDAVAYPDLVALIGANTPNLANIFIKGSDLQSNINGFTRRPWLTGRPKTPLTMATSGSHHHLSGYSENNPSRYGSESSSNQQRYSTQDGNTNAPKTSTHSGHTHTINGGGDALTEPTNMYMAYFIKAVV
ncbi:MAG TPA: tail fiber protein [Methylophaga sp.]|nr:tail fiber protein [Methylophaga sp.]